MRMYDLCLYDHLLACSCACVVYLNKVNRDAICVNGIKAFKDSIVCGYSSVDRLTCLLIS